MAEWKYKNGGGFWFLTVLLMLGILYVIVDYILKKITGKIMIAQTVISLGLLTFGYWCSINGFGYRNLEKVASYYWLFHFGRILSVKRHIFAEKKLYKYVIVAVGTGSILCYLQRFGWIALDRNYYINPLFFVSASILGWFFVFSISCCLKQTILKDSLTFIGKNTLLILILHFLCFKFVTVIVVICYKLPMFCVAAFPNLYGGRGLWWIAYTVVGVALPLILPFCKQKHLKGR